MIRVSGSVGLSMSDNDFTRYNESQTNYELKKGPISDDILLVGFCNEGVVLYPVEVKSGSADMQKALQQVKALKSFFYDHLFSGNSLKSRLLKGLFIRQVFMQVEKYQLYDVFDENYFNSLYEKREYLLDGNYPLIELDSHSEGAVVAFLDVQLDTSITFKENILEFRLPFEFQSQMLHTSYSVLSKKLHNEEFGTNKSYMLQKSECSEVTKEPGIHEEGHEPLESEQQKEVELEYEAQELEKKDELVKVKGPMRIKFGTCNRTKDEVFWYPTDTTRTLNTNTGIIGTMGTGKTQFTKSLIAQMMQNAHNNVDASPIGVLIFDYKGDYIKADFTEPTNAKVLEPYHLPYNPLALFGDRALLPTHTTNLFKTTLSKAFGLGMVQQSNLTRIILEAYERRGISKNGKETWIKPAPTIQDIWDVFVNEEKMAFDSLYAALEKLINFEVFEPNPEKTVSLYDLVDGITVINLSGYDSDIQSLIVAITLDIFYTQMHIKGSSKHSGDFRQITKMILVDEADNFMSQDFESLKKILKEGREFGVGTILSTQQLTHFKTSEDNYANYIQTWIVHQVSNIKAQDISSIFNISNKTDSEGLMEQIRKLEKHFSVYVDGNKNRIKMRDLAFWEL
jgi:DNA phosphorothioation-dependent restriction protein DptH